MAKRKKSSKRSVRCTLCTKHRWLGNAKGRFKAKEEAVRKVPPKKHTKE